ncbi:aspartate kinase [Macrolepiota fuliginosa MF-IS2]|uniref:aspartate kinase n=1 Tax=Macrolepiota fuliginosa MF-IS2 TaxID=1400762 RepID=A0A9P5X674_9AGAR|nr:aspartate kinase [Macrolepiota fuliginosa MF-IS2]
MSEEQQQQLVSSTLDEQSPSSSVPTSESPSPPSSSDEGPATPPNLHQNSIDPAAKWLVQKYGGTSVGKFAVRIAEDIVANYIDQHKIAIVCSARSGSTKALGTTNLLLKASAEALRRPTNPNGNKPADTPGTGTVTPISRGLFGVYSEGSQSPPMTPHSRSSSSLGTGPFSGLGFTPIINAKTPAAVPDFVNTVELLKQEHITAARECVTRSPRILQELEEEIYNDCDWLTGFLYALKVIDEISPRSRDTIVGLGEKLACKLMTAILRDRGIDAEYVSLEDIVPAVDDADGTLEQTLDQEFYDRLTVALGERVKQCAPRVPVVTGYFGPVPGSLLRQVGRGYTDLCSALLAVGLEASELQIWKEVDGIFTADPRKVSTARLIPIISPDEAAELTYYGSEVVHPFTMEQVIRRRIPIRIKNVENPTGGGTVIHPDPDADAPHLHQDSSNPPSIPEPVSPMMLLALEAEADSPHRKRLPTAVTIKENIVVLNVHSNRKSVSHGFLAGIFSTLDRFGVVVDLITTSEVHVSMAIEDGLAKKLLDRLVRELKKSGTVSVHKEMAILSLVGKHMRNMVGIAGRMFTTLAQGNVNIEMISQGASEINISCVIESRDAAKALNLIHQSCLQIKPEGTMGRVGPWLF